MLPFRTAKRSREEDVETDAARFTKKSRNQSFQHHNNPPFSTLLLQPSLTPSPPHHFSRASTMTPAQSPHSVKGDADDIHISSDPMNDVEMEDDFDIIGSQPNESPPAFMRPAKLNALLFSEPASNTGRIPTPMFGTFFAPRGPDSRNTEYLQDYLQPVVPTVFPKQPTGARDRRMPSPISEDEDIPLTQSQLCRLSMASNNNSSETMDTDSMDHDQGEHFDGTEPQSPSTARKGRARSGALIGKMRFSMGYREDCDKCRNRIPGHYSHFLPS
ncbi:hypothetical protein GQ43DRAFT_475653 [Delitschia confertaspora ATCC 74209]|uniref:Uncharacterized protein n=1 Tax=Delitschia confertaspora ATCC 74209 TaxID=1513339 RepID=A0A9P4JD89_9PLEO|nr:hypothetical protein GQ43DRAFT_475653 [Delitschia confertaspora ATCC 74209]